MVDKCTQAVRSDVKDWHNISGKEKTKLKKACADVNDYEVPHIASHIIHRAPNIDPQSLKDLIPGIFLEIPKAITRKESRSKVENLKTVVSQRIARACSDFGLAGANIKIRIKNGDEKKALVSVDQVDLDFQTKTHDSYKEICRERAVKQLERVAWPQATALNHQDSYTVSFRIVITNHDK